jgi:hypothetical protein
VAILGDLVESYLLYASAVLAAMGVVASELAFFFHLRLKKLAALSRNAEATVFSCTFTVFDPYEKKTILHRFLPFFMTVPFIGAMGLGVVLLVLVSSGMLLAILAVVLSVGLIATSESFEAHSESRLLIKAMENGDKLGTGDIGLLEATKMILSRLTWYYVGLAAFLFALAAVFPIFWSNILQYFTKSIGLLIQISTILGPAGWFISLAVYGSVITALLIVITAVKNRLFGYGLGPSDTEQNGSFRSQLIRSRIRAPPSSSDERGKPKKQTS